MAKKILVVSGSPKKNGNTSVLVGWFSEGARSKGALVEVVDAAGLKNKVNGCSSCRMCQKAEAYGCVISDDAGGVTLKMPQADVIVMATPLYFFSASAQLKIIVDRMFSLYKWDNAAGTMKTILNGKTFVLIASAYEEMGMEELEKPFVLTARYSGMKYSSLLVPNAGVSGDIIAKEDIKAKAVALGQSAA